MLFNIQYTMSKCLLKCLTFCSYLFPLLARIAESRNVPCPNRRNYSYKLYSPCQTDRRLFGNKISFSCQSNLPFCGDDEEEIRPKTYRGLPQAFHGINRGWIGFSKSSEKSSRSLAFFSSAMFIARYGRMTRLRPSLKFAANRN